MQHATASASVSAQGHRHRQLNPSCQTLVPIMPAEHPQPLQGRSLKQAPIHYQGTPSSHEQRAVHRRSSNTAGASRR